LPKSSGMAPMPSRAPSGITPTRAANVLAAVLSEALRRHDGYHPRSLLDYARQKLFDPLGVDTEPAYTGYEWQAPQTSRFEEAGFGWGTDKRGRFYGAFGIRLRARDMANFGSSNRPRATSVTRARPLGESEGRVLVPGIDSSQARSSL
jgi:CubicO group peptidase (beta-lactamase class C family)